ncbi:hypothetical protein QAD02_017170 [Eretmocerus hayati]|uniref:Uncharacterized protein n=1 Tax=Eretmocerus hayati TaxID=131215 RepID=A0ACC2PD46_9HYME|nr:hypothetical protein QAD02_017170 [Eretmocerus hayati]
MSQGQDRGRHTKLFDPGSSTTPGSAIAHAPTAKRPHPRKQMSHTTKERGGGEGPARATQAPPPSVIYVTPPAERDCGGEADSSSRAIIISRASDASCLRAPKQTDSASNRGSNSSKTTSRRPSVSFVVVEITSASDSLPVACEKTPRSDRYLHEVNRFLYKIVGMSDHYRASEKKLLQKTLQKYIDSDLSDEVYHEFKTTMQIQRRRRKAREAKRKLVHAIEEGEAAVTPQQRDAPTDQGKSDEAILGGNEESTSEADCTQQDARKRTRHLGGTHKRSGQHHSGRGATSGQQRRPDA